MKDKNTGSSEQADLSRYKQAADVAYRYAKDKLESKYKPQSKEEEPVFSSDKKEFEQ